MPWEPTSCASRVLCRASPEPLHLGVDLGTTFVTVATAARGVILREPTLVAVERNTGKITEVGEKAARALTTSPGLVPLRPVREGVVASLEAADALLNQVFRRANKFRVWRPTVAITVPAEVTQVERRAVLEAALKAGAKKVETVPKPLAAAYGARLDLSQPEGHMIVDLGGGSTDAGIVSLDALVVAGTVRIGGQQLDEAVVRMLRRVHGVMIGESTAENIKIQLGSAFPQGTHRTLDVNGQDLVDGLPRSVSVSEDEVREALEQPLSEIVAGLRRVLERTPPELAADVHGRGILLTGGAAHLTGLATMLERLLGVSVRVADKAQDCVALGAARLGA